MTFKNSLQPSAIYLVLLLSCFSVSAGGDGHKIDANKNSDSSIAEAYSSGPIISNAEKKCIESYKNVAAKICKDFSQFNLSKSQLDKVRSKVVVRSKEDNMWWTEQRISEALKFLDGYQNASSTFKVNEELWCTLGASTKDDQYEKSLALAHERCAQNKISSAVDADSKGLKDLQYMFGSLASSGLDREAKIASASLDRLNSFKNSLGVLSVSDVDHLIDQLSSARENLTSNTKISKKVYADLLKQCYEAEQLNIKSFKARRPQAPRGFDCASFDKAENP